jgi:hypothetical protein
MVTHVNTTPMDYVKNLPQGPNTCILGWTFKKTLNVVGKKICWIFFKKKEISTIHLTNYINFNNLWNHANNLNHLDYDWNLVAILFNLVHGSFELWWPRSKEWLPLFNPIQVAITHVQKGQPNFIHFNKKLCMSKLLSREVPTKFQWCWNDGKRCRD